MRNHLFHKIDHLDNRGADPGVKNLLSRVIMKNDASNVEVLRAPTIAIIDDDQELAKAMGRILRANYQCVVNNYPSVEDFLEAADRSTANERPEDFADLILLDFHLPGQNGPVLVKELENRKSPLLNRSRIVGISADTENTVLFGFREAGITDVITKPLQHLDYSRLADRAYRISQNFETLPPDPVFKDTY